MVKTLLLFITIALCSVVSPDNIYKYYYYQPGYDLKEIEQAYRGIGFSLCLCSTVINWFTVNNLILNATKKTCVKFSLSNVKNVDTYLKTSGQDRHVEHPCAVYDLLCLRRYLTKHSKCKIAEGPVPDPLYATEITTFYPSFNITVTQLELSFRGLTGTASEFTVNRKSQVTIIKVDFKNLRAKARKVFFRYHRRGREPAVTSSTTDDEYFLFKGVDHISLAESESVVFFDTIGIVVLGKDAGEHSDPTIAPRFAKFQSNPYLVLQEAYLTAAPFYAGTFIQNVLCDFRLKLS